MLPEQRDGGLRLVRLRPRMKSWRQAPRLKWPSRFRRIDPSPREGSGPFHPYQNLFPFPKKMGRFPVKFADLSHFAEFTELRQLSHKLRGIDGSSGL